MTRRSCSPAPFRRRAGILGILVVRVAPAHMSEELYNASRHVGLHRLDHVHLSAEFLAESLLCQQIRGQVCLIVASRRPRQPSCSAPTSYDATKIKAGASRLLLQRRKCGTHRELPLRVRVRRNGAIPLSQWLRRCFSGARLLPSTLVSEVAFLTVLSIVPLIVHWSKKFTPGTTSNILGSLYHVFTTVFAFFFPTARPVTGGNLDYCIARL
ncbi:hypothetical protein V1527DRAFT_474371, partial [Lipomyces starkeyi]